MAILAISIHLHYDDPGLVQTVVNWIEREYEAEMQGITRNGEYFNYQFEGGNLPRGKRNIEAHVSEAFSTIPGILKITINK